VGTQASARYGENPHQRAALYASGADADGIAGALQLHGKAMSYNNYVDADTARHAVFDFGEPCVAIVKHSNPCGIAIGADIAAAHRKAHSCGPESAFGGVIAANGVVTADMARQVAMFHRGHHRSGFEPAALDILTAKKNSGCCAARRPPAQLPSSGGRSAAACCCSPRTRQTRQATPGNWQLAAGRPSAMPAARSGLRLEGMPQREVKRHPARRDGGSVGVGMGQVNGWMPRGWQ